MCKTNHVLCHPSPNWTLELGTSLGLGLGGLDLGIGLDNSKIHTLPT